MGLLPLWLEAHPSQHEQAPDVLYTREPEEGIGAGISGGVRMLGGNGFFSTVADNNIKGGATIDGYSGFWLGFIQPNVVSGTKVDQCAGL